VLSGDRLKTTAAEPGDDLGQRVRRRQGVRPGDVQDEDRAGPGLRDAVLTAGDSRGVGFEVHDGQAGVVSSPPAAAGALVVSVAAVPALGIVIGPVVLVSCSGRPVVVGAAHDPRHALDDRSGFSNEESAGRWVAALLDEHWGVRIDSSERIAMSGGKRASGPRPDDVREPGDRPR
jgi:hypothetical protein